jgi:GNAT superfamily N-acetyltransferase
MIVADDGSAFEKPLVERIDVIEGYRGQGVGTALLRHIATTYGTIDIVPDNEGAARLYARLGAELSFTDYNAYGFAFDQNFGVYEIRG